MDAMELGARLSAEAYRPVDTDDDASARMAALSSMLPKVLSVRTARLEPDAAFGAFCVTVPGKSYIVFRGTADIRDGLVDAEVAPASFLCPGSAISALVPSGVLRAFVALRRWLDGLGPFGTADLEVDGHSAGGWLAEICAVYLVAVTDIRTYGCPRISWGTAFLDGLHHARAAIDAGSSTTATWCRMSRPVRTSTRAPASAWTTTVRSSPCHPTSSSGWPTSTAWRWPTTASPATSPSVPPTLRGAVFLDLTSTMPPRTTPCASWILCLGSLRSAWPLSRPTSVINISPNQSVSPFNVPVQVALTTSEVGVNLTQSTPGYWVLVQVFSPSAWTYRSTTGSSTAAFPVLANQVLTIMVFYPNQQFWPVGSTTQTLYVIPLYYIQPNP